MTFSTGTLGQAVKLKMMYDVGATLCSGLSLHVHLELSMAFRFSFGETSVALETLREHINSAIVPRR